MTKARFPFAGSIPLQWILVIPFVLQVLAAVGIIGFLSFRNGQKAVNDLASQLINKASQQVDEHLNSYLALPIQLTQMNVDAIATGDLNVYDKRASERYLWRQSRAFKNLTYVGYALTDGREIGAGRWIKGMDVVLYDNLPGAGEVTDYATDAQGNPTRALQTYDYDPLTDAWYQDTIRAGKLIWTRIYATENTNIEVSEAGKDLQESNDVDLNTGLEYYVAVSAAAPFYDKNHKLLGAMATDLLLTNISEFLRELKVSASGQVFIIGRDGLLIGSSSHEPIFHKTNDEVKRYGALESPDLLTRAIAQSIQAHSQTLQSIQSQQTFRMTYNGERQYVQVTPWKDDYGLDWLVVVSVPESDFMSQIHANTRTTILLCLGALGIATVLGIITSQRITRPILELNQASRAIAAGHLDQQVAASGIHELDTVGQSFNRMAEQLQASFTALEQNNAELENRVMARTQELSQKNIQLENTLEELRQAQLQMVQSEKMSALGQMVAGVAHEINNPVNFIHGNLSHVSEYTQNLLELVQAYQTQYPDPPQSIQDLLEHLELEFIAEDLTKLLQSMKVGTHRIREIVLSLRNFSRLDEAEFKTVNIHEGLDNTLMLLHHRLRARPDRPEIYVVKHYGSLPLVQCYAGQLNQVFMNLLSNAIDALEEKSQDRCFEEMVENPNMIWIHTSATADQQVRITIADNGPGISDEVRSQLFNPFFTTKPVGKGTGLGLSISYQIITEKHHGTLWCDSSSGQGAKFTLEIPVSQSQ
ncbi:MAG TPA: ATP-binding protein [Crinalium sp.]|jgi:signal transduction histidine kinase